MYNLIRKNQKKLMAIFGVVLMIAFIVPAGINRMGNDYQHVVGQAGKEKISGQQVQQAEDQWRFLAQNVAVRAQPSAEGQAQWQPIIVILPEPALTQIQDNPEMYYLLQLEGRKMGLTPNLAQAEQMLSDPRVGVRMQNGSIVSIDSLTDQRMVEGVKHYLANLLMIENAFRRAVDAVKISQPLARHEVAAQLQQIKVQVVDFPARNYEEKVPAPTAEQLQQQFDRFSEFEADAPPTEKNPFGFGYKYPNRVKLQYIGIPRSEVRKAVLAGKSEYEWEVEASKYYRKHQDEFPTTQPATTQEAFSLGPVAAKPPTTRPFAEVKQDAIDKVVEPMVSTMQRQIQRDLSARLDQAYEAHRSANPDSATTAPAATAPAGGAASYDGFDYIQSLAKEIQSRFKVTLTVASISDSFKDAAELQRLPGIGDISGFPEYVTSAVEPFVAESQRNDPNVLSLFEPSKPISTFGDAGDVYIFRITAAQPAQKPDSIAEVKERVEADWRRAAAYELAKADAAKLLDDAAKRGLAPAASSAGLKLITTGAFPMSAAVPIENYPLTTRAQASFVRQTYALLAALSGQKDAKPVSLVEMPPDAKVAVAELIAVESSIKPESIELAETYFTVQLMQQYQMAMANDWFNYDSLVQRLEYTDMTGRSRPTRPQQAAAN